MDQESSQGELLEHCGIVGAMALQNKPVLEKDAAALMRRVFDGARELSHRGQEGWGVAGLRLVKTEAGEGHFKQLRWHTEEGTIPRQAPLEAQGCLGDAVIAQTRYGTSGDGTKTNCQPIVLNTKFGMLAVAHNGQITNTKELTRKLVREFHVALPPGASDTWLIPYLIHHQKTTSLEKAVKAAALLLEGSFSLLILHENGLLALRDRFGIRPLFYGVNKSVQQFCLASETPALTTMGVKSWQVLEPGQLVSIRFDCDSLSSRKPEFASVIPLRRGEVRRYCPFELVYFARPDGYCPVTGSRVALLRMEMGRRLALKDQAADFTADVVVGVPESARDIGVDYANASGLPYVEALRRNRIYLRDGKRTFMAPTQEERENMVRQKFLVITELVKGNRVVLVDDSIVRSTTIRILVAMLFENGAAEVHVRLAFPKVVESCPLGIDIATKDELIAPGRNDAEIAKLVGATSVRYLDPAEMLAAVSGKEWQGESWVKAPYCSGCYGGCYPTLK